MKYIDFSSPESYDQIEAIGGLYKALFALAKAFDIEKPFALIKQVASSARYDMQNLLEKQAEAAKPKEDAKTDEPPKKTEAGTPDDPINLDDIPF